MEVAAVDARRKSLTRERAELEAHKRSIRAGQSLVNLEDLATQRRVVIASATAIFAHPSVRLLLSPRSHAAARVFQRRSASLLRKGTGRNQRNVSEERDPAQESPGHAVASVPEVAVKAPTRAAAAVQSATTPVRRIRVAARVTILQSLAHPKDRDLRAITPAM